MYKKQSICLLAALGLFLAAAAVIEAHPLISLVLVVGMLVPMYIGRLGKKRVTCADIERMCKDAKN